MPCILGLLELREFGLGNVVDTSADDREAATVPGNGHGDRDVECDISGKMSLVEHVEPGPVMYMMPTPLPVVPRNSSAPGPPLTHDDIARVRCDGYLAARLSHFIVD